MADKLQYACLPISPIFKSLASFSIIRHSEDQEDWEDNVNVYNNTRKGSEYQGEGNKRILHSANPGLAYQFLFLFFDTFKTFSLSRYRQFLNYAGALPNEIEAIILTCQMWNCIVKFRCKMTQIGRNWCFCIFYGGYKRVQLETFLAFSFRIETPIKPLDGCVYLQYRKNMNCVTSESWSIHPALFSIVTYIPLKQSHT